VADGNLPASEKLLGWAVVICILIPIASMAVDKNIASIEVFFGSLMRIVLVSGILVGAGLIAYAFYIHHTKAKETADERAAYIADIYRQTRETYDEYKRLYDIAARPLPMPEEVFADWRPDIELAILREGFVFDPETLHRFRALFFYLDTEPDFRPAEPLQPYEPDKPIPLGFNIDMDIEYLRPLALASQLFDYDLITKALTQSILAFLRHLPRPSEQPTPWKVPASQLIPVGQTIVDVLAPFCTPELKARGLCKTVREKYGAGYAVTGVWPVQYKGEDVLELYLIPAFRELFNIAIPFQPFTDEMRFTHHWCMGDNGSGKTTFLRHFIKDDLARVAREECSLFVVDSKRLVREMRTLKDFAAGQPLDGHLILIDADAIFPLNPFKLPKAQGVPLLVYMLAGLTEASKLQMGVLRHYVNAAYSMTNPTLYSLSELMLTPKDKLPAGLNPDRLDDVTRKWFLHTRRGVAALTSGGIEQRLMDFLAEFRDGPFLKMLNADSFALDMREIQRGGKVLLVDTSRRAFGKEAGALLGRLVIALIDQLASERTDHPGPPVFVVIDEAQDYIARDEIFADILEKARSSKIGMTIAHHHLKQSGGFIPGVVAALEQAGIKSRCHDVGSVHITTRKKEFDLPVKKLEFDHEPQMERDDYAVMRERLAFVHPYKPASRTVENDDLPLTEKNR
jgi:hypothetical protein